MKLLHALLLLSSTILFTACGQPTAPTAPSSDTLPNTANGDSVKVRLSTNQGDIGLELYPDKAPATVKNFLNYVDQGFYDGTIFHRVIPGFMIQGGGFTQEYEKKPTAAPIPNEADNGLPNQRGSLAMARTSDPHSATAQFFINLKDNSFLNHTAKTSRGWGYAVFGRVTQGMDIVDRIAASETGPAGPFRKDAPKQPIVITKAQRLP